MSGRNIKLAYLLAFLKNSWFWLGIWVFYYLRFTGYSGIGLIETVLIVTMTVAEIPTGAVADLFGKRKTLILSFFLQGVGNIFMGISPDFSFLAFSVFIAAIGGTLYSGTLEALVYDSLKLENKESGYGKIISNINAMLLIAPALCGAVGGFMYVIRPGLPFLASGTLSIIGCLICLLLTEPNVDTVKFSIKNFVVQTQAGIKQLSKTFDIKKQTIFLLSIGLVVVIADEMLNSFLGVEFGFDAKLIGIFWALIYIVSAFASRITPALYKTIGEKSSLIITGAIIGISLAISPALGLILGGFSLFVRTSFQAVYYNLASISINNHTESKYRATTLSTFNMLRNIPYVLTAFFIGSLSDRYSAKSTAMFLGFLLLILLGFQLVSFRKDNLRLR